MSEDSQESRQKLDINPIQVLASALAAVTSAVLLSTVGVAGTIIGAALGSLFATAGAALYSYSIRVSRERMAAAQAAAIAKVNRKRVGAPTGDIEVQEKPEDQGRPPLRESLARLPWKWIAIVASAIFVATMIGILGFELITGRSVSTYTGGSSGGGHRTSLGFGTSTHATQTPTPTPSSSATPSQGSTSSAPASTSPSTAPQQVAPSSTPSATLPTPPASDTASSSPSGSPSN